MAEAPSTPDAPPKPAKAAAKPFDAARFRFHISGVDQINNEFPRSAQKTLEALKIRAARKKLLQEEKAA